MTNQQDPQRAEALEELTKSRSAEEVFAIASAGLQVVFRELADLRAWLTLLQDHVAQDQRDALHQQFQAHLQSPEHLQYREQVAQSISKKAADVLKQMQQAMSERG